MFVTNFKRRDSHLARPGVDVLLKGQAFYLEESVKA
jgi:hypothetical protein